MMYLKTVTYFLVLYIRLVVGQMDKISLTFVIDDTGSMQGDIDQVKEGVNLIFDSVTKSKDSPIADFIIVTFNDKRKYDCVISIGIGSANLWESWSYLMDMPLNPTW